MLGCFSKIIFQVGLWLFLWSGMIFAQDIKDNSCVTMHDIPASLSIHAGSNIAATISFFLTAEALNKYENLWSDTYGKKGFKRKVSLVFFLEDELPMGNTSVPYEAEQSLSEVELDVAELQVGWNKFEVKSKLSSYMKGNYRVSTLLAAEPLDPTKGYAIPSSPRFFLPALTGCSEDLVFKVENHAVFDLFGPARYNAFLQRPAIPNPKEEYLIGESIPLSFYGFDANTAICSQETKGQGFCKDGYAKISLKSKNKESQIQLYEVSVLLTKSQEDYGYKKLYEVYTMNLKITKRMPEGENFISLRVYDIAGNNHTIYPYGKINVKLK